MTAGMVGPMAKLYYGNQDDPIDIPDDLLAHVKIVVTTKLRRGESFLMSWSHADGNGRSSIWIQPSIAMRFVFDTVHAPEIDRALLASLAVAANSNSGLVVRLAEAGRHDDGHERMPVPPVEQTVGELTLA
ncbi:DUF7882 family protein [Microbacterium flavescens]|uniref:DUF7882 family protein n=1 Tax=Microbacterium flavescens TaxID=69366 RepID=UPI001BDE8DB8|nr:hypothetical protein [Microbacterium flavescens]